MMEHLTSEQREHHASLYAWLYEAANQLSINSREYATAEMLSNLALSLLDPSVLKIIAYLKIQQKTFERELWKDRKTKIKKLNEKRDSFKISIKKKFEEGKISKSEKKALLKKVKYDYENKVKTIDMKIYGQLQQLIHEQQEKLSNADVPGFYITEDNNLTTLQMHFLKCITEMKTLFDLDAIMKDIQI